MLLNDGEVIDLDNNKRGTTQADQKQKSIGESELEEPKSIRYFYDGWLRINSTEDLNKPYVIFNRGKDFIMTLTGHKLSIIHTTDTASGKGVNPNTGILASETSAGQHTTIMDIALNFPFQKWVYFCINVDGNTMDAYLNGKLVKSVTDVKKSDGNILKFYEASKTDPLTMGNIGTKGSIARFRREPRLLDPQTVWSIYLQGPGVTNEDDSAGDYHAKIELTRNNHSRRKFKLF